MSHVLPDRDPSPDHLLRLAALRAELARPPFHAVLQPRAEMIDPDTGTVTIGLPFRPELRRSPEDNGVHGGVIACLIDIAAHAAVAMGIGRMAPTIDLRLDYLRVAEGDLRAVAKVIRSGRMLARADVEVTDGRDRLVAVGRGTFSTAPPTT